MPLAMPRLSPVIQTSREPQPWFPKLDGEMKAFVWQIQRQLEADVARPMLGWRTEYFAAWPRVHGLVPQNAL